MLTNKNETKSTNAHQETGKSIIEKAPSSVTTYTKPEHYSPTTKTQQKTRITIKYDVGFSNQITIRGKGIPSLTWEKGQVLKNIKTDEWVWETDAHFTQFEFKVLINDRIYEKGENHLLNHGSSVVYTPKF